MQDDDGSYTFDEFDKWLNNQLIAGYQAVGLPIYTYTNRWASCSLGDAIFIPKYVERGPDNVAGTVDDPLLIASSLDTRDCDGDGEDDVWYLIDYDDPDFLAQYESFIRALADHILSHPQADKIKWIATGSGRDGETITVDNGDKGDVDLTSEQWIDTVNAITNFYLGAFSDNAGNPLIPVLVQNAPFHLHSYERRDIGAHAANQGAGVSINAITADFDNTESCGHSSPDIDCAGMWDATRLYSDTVPIMFESYGYMMGTENEFYWSMTRALDSHADYIRLSSFWASQDLPANRSIAEWAAKYMGTGFLPHESTPPSIWSQAWEHRRPCFWNYAGPGTCNYYPPVGNSEFYLQQLHGVPGGTTIAVTDDSRVTDMGWSGVAAFPWHTNASPYDSNLANAGLFNLNNSGSQIQIEVDPGWSSRHSDQASGNYGFFYNADDRYLSPVFPLHGINQVIISATYLDSGTDRWQLMYDGGGGVMAAEVYAIQDWDVRIGLAVGGVLPGVGLQNPRPIYVQKLNSGRWKTATFLIEDGYFGNRLAGGADFYIDSRSDSGANDGDEYIPRIDVQRQDKGVVENLRLSAAGSTATLTWDPAPGDTDHYEVWRSSDPYFAPDAGAEQLGDDIVAAGPFYYIDTTAETGYFYMVLAVEAGGGYSHYQSRVGKFDFAFSSP